MKVLRCRDVGADCDFEVHAESEDEILRQAAEHGRTVHGMNEFSDDLKSRLLAAVRDVQVR